MNKYIAYFDGSHNPKNNSGGYGFIVYDVNKEKRFIEWGKLNRKINNSSDCQLPTDKSVGLSFQLP